MNKYVIWLIWVIFVILRLVVAKIGLKWKLRLNRKLTIVIFFLSNGLIVINFLLVHIFENRFEIKTSEQIVKLDFNII